MKHDGEEGPRRGEQIAIPEHRVGQLHVRPEAADFRAALILTALAGSKLRTMGPRLCCPHHGASAHARGNTRLLVLS
jgi:hypothetical protein